MEVERLIAAAYAPTTKAAYDQGIEQFTNFRIRCGLKQLWPAPSSHMIHFVASLSLQGKAHSTVRTYLAGVSNKHKMNNWNDPTQHFVVKKLLEGLARSSKQCDTRAPITFQRLQQLVSALPSVCSNVYEQHLFTAAFTMAFFGFLRVSELVGQGRDMASGRTGLRRTEIVINDDLFITLSGSKTDQRGKGTQLVLKRVVNTPAVCPVLAMQKYLQVRPSGSNVLFIHFGGGPLTRYQFQAVLKRAAAVCGWNTAAFSSHSFRIGAATTAAMNGVAQENIKQMGRWQSQAVQRYVRLDIAR